MAKRQGRSGKAPRHVRLYFHLLESPAWRSLDPVARALYVELSARYNGSNNGRIAYSVREAAEALQSSRATASRAFTKLADRGFIVACQLGAFRTKKRHATEWRLTEHWCDLTMVAASKEFMRWTPNSLRKPVPLVRPSVPLMKPIGPSSETVNPRRSLS